LQPNSPVPPASRPGWPTPIATLRRNRLRFLRCRSVTPASAADGIHLDADQHARLGKALAAFVAGLAGFSPLTQR